MYIFAPEMYILAPKMYILTHKTYKLVKWTKVYLLKRYSHSDSFRTFFLRVFLFIKMHWYNTR